MWLWLRHPLPLLGPTSLHCICPSQGADVLCMQTHGTAEWINDPTSDKFYTHLNASQFLVQKVPSDFPFPSSVYFLFCFSSSSFSSLCGFAYSPIPGACSWNGFNSSFGCPQGFLFPSPLWLLDSWLFTVSNSNYSLLQQILFLRIFLQLSLLFSSGCLPFRRQSLPCALSSPVALGHSCFLWGRPRLSPFLSRGCLLPAVSSCAFCGALAAFSVSHFPFLSYLHLKSVTLDSYDL